MIEGGNLPAERAGYPYGTGISNKQLFTALILNYGR